MTEAAGELIELRRISRLLAYLVTKDSETQKEKIEILDGAGLTPKEIAEFLVTTPNAVSVALVGIRKERDSGPRAKSRRATKRTASRD